MKTIDGICRSLAVRRLRHSSSSRPSVMTLALVPVATMEIASTIRVAPVPGAGFSTMCSGVGPSIRVRTKGSRSSASAWARSASLVNGNSPRRSSSRSDRAAAISPGVGRSGTDGGENPGGGS